MKHRPDTCPECGFVWGARHGRRHGDGYEQLAANVWKCARCGRVVRSRNGDGRRVTH